MWCRRNSAKDERFYQQVRRDNPGLPTPLDTKPALWDAGKPALLAYNFVLRWADGFGGVSHDALEWYLTCGDGAPLAPETKELIRRGVDRLIDQDRRLAAEEAEKARNK